MLQQCNLNNKKNYKTKILNFEINFYIEIIDILNFIYFKIKNYIIYNIVALVISNLKRYDFKYLQIIPIYLI